MRLNTQPTDTVEMSGVVANSQFTIRASAKAFSILSDGLYANKIRAVVRELSTNALDSHIAAGRGDVPFDVNLPNALAPWFSVRDYGVGLTHDEVVSIYTSYFTSTKSDSDEFVGALGLGSKSPFSYTDNFTVTAIKDGRKGLYSAYIDDTGVPSIALMSESATDEPTGVEVKFSVNTQEDFWKFLREAGYVYRHFPVKPNFTGEELELDDVTYYRKDILPGVHLRNERGSGANTVIMGCIEYPVNLPAGAVPKDLEYLEHKGIEINLPIGAVEMAASREELSYTRHTIDAIVAVYRQVSAVLEQTWSADVAKYTNLWEQALFIHQSARHGLLAGAVKNWLANNPHPLVAYDGYYVRMNELIVNQEDVARDYNINLSTIQVDWDNAMVRSPRSFNIHGPNGQYTTTKGWEIPVSTKGVVFVEGKGVGPVARARYWGKSNKGDVQWIILATPVDRKQPMQWKRFLESIHNPPTAQILDMEQFPVPPKVQREAATPVWKFELTRKGYGDWNAVSRPAGTMQDIEADGETTTYVKLYKHETHLNGVKFDLRTAMTRLKNAGLLVDNKIRVYGFRGNDLETVIADPLWVPFDVAVRKMINGYVEDDFIAMYMKTLDEPWGRLYTKWANEGVFDGSPILELHPYVGRKITSNWHELRPLVEEFGSAETKAAEASAAARVKNIAQRYPLIKHLSGYIDRQLVVDYVKLIDNAN